MAKNTEPVAKRCKALGISPAVMGYTNKDFISVNWGYVIFRKLENMKE